MPKGRRIRNEFFRKRQGFPGGPDVSATLRKEYELNNKEAIVNISKQLIMISERICSLANGIAEMESADPGLADTYYNFLIDEVTHVQITALELTRFTTQGETANADDSVFAAGELNSVIGEKEDPDSPER